MRFKDLKINVRMYIGFIFATALTLLVGIIGYLNISKIVYQLEVSKIVNRIIVDAGDAQAGSLRYIIYNDEKYYAQVEEEANNILALSADVNNLLLSVDNKKRTDQIIYLIDSYKADNIAFYKLEQEKKIIHQKRIDAAIGVTNQIIEVIDAATTYSKNNKKDYLAVERVYMVQNARNAMNRVRITANKYVADPSDEYAKDLTLEIDGIYVLLKKAEKLMVSDHTKKAIEDVFIALDNYIREFTTYKILVETQFSIQVDQRKNAASLLAEARSLRKGVYDYIEETESRMYFQLLVVIFLAIVFGLLIGTIITRSITVPLAKGVTFANNISNGDLTQYLTIEQKDEIGHLATTMNNMSNKLKRIVTSVISCSEHIVELSNQVSTTVHQMSEGYIVLEDEELSPNKRLAVSSKEMINQSKRLKEMINFFKVPTKN